MLINAFDIETFTKIIKSDIDEKNIEVLIPYCLCYSHKNNLENFYGLDCIEKFVKLLLELEEDTLWFAHNLTFDGTFIIQELIKIKYKFDTLLIDSNIYYLSLTNNKNYRIIMKCSYKFIPLALKKINEFLSVDKKIEINHKEINQNNFDSPEISSKVISYCYNDVTVVIQVVKIFINCIENFGKNLIYECNSISSISLKIFKLFYNNFNITLKLKIDDDNIIRNSYYGGRCEVFGNVNSNEKVYHYDFPGMYSQVMLEKFPIGPFKFIDKPLDTNQPGFYYIKFFSNMEIPILPYRDLNTKKLLFPNGELEGLYWYEEINFFKSNGGMVIEIQKGYIFNKINFVFSEFSQKMIELRKIDKNHKFIYKIILNSLYGRLGLSYSPYETKILSEKKYLKINPVKIHKWIKINNTYITTLHTKLKPTINSNIIYAAIITSKARIKLYKGYNSVIKHGCRLLYSDTDSIFAAAPNNLQVLDIHIGDVYFNSQAEDSQIIDSVFILPKTYGVTFQNNKSKIKIKGITRPPLTITELKKKFNGENTLSFNLNLLTHKKNFYYSETNILKIINLNNYDKRIFTHDKKYTKPLTLNIKY